MLYYAGVLRRLSAATGNHLAVEFHEGEESVHPLLKQAAQAAIPGPIYRSLRRRRLHREIAAYPDREVEHSYAGQRLRLILEDPLAEGWYDHDWGPQPEIELLRRGRLGPGARVFDLGAHQAVVALILAREVGDDGEVIAVEAEPHNARAAAKNRELNAAANLTVLHAAIANVPGTLYFSESLNGMVLPGGRAGKVAVDAVTVDGLAERFGPPDVVFIDVEGYEGKALEGASATLDDRRCDFFVEIHDAPTLTRAGGSVDRVVAEFTNRHFHCLVSEPANGSTGAQFRQLSSAIHKRGDRCYLVAFAPMSA